MFLKSIFIFLIVIGKLLFAETYFDEIKIINNDDHIINYSVEVAASKIDQEKGLMYRKVLNKKSGMLFIFKKEKVANFWMKNTYIPLDIIFIKKNGSVDLIKKNVKPLNLKTIKSKGKVIAVLEINAGEVEEFGIDEGSIVNVKKFINN
ncbi:MAG: DUF192 domain-containing protein [Pseudomonadota bacterium]|nr:DUF192 domain-containing protein [Pseudomonadota bacterium]